jgi:hypothetical protein
MAHPPRWDVQRATRIEWGHVLERARPIVDTYSTMVTLRQLFYRLVAAEVIPNTTTAYKRLSSVTAEARRQGTFPALMDRTRRIHRDGTFSDPDDAIGYMLDVYRRDRTEGQDVSVYLAVEKAGMVEQITSWFGGRGVPVLALGGYASQSYVDEVILDVERQGRPAVLLYAGDHDPEGEDIDRDFVARTDCWATVERVALTAEQVDAYQLPPMPGKAESSRAAGFVARHGRLVQVELDALPPDVLRQLYTEALDAWWDESAWDAVMAREAADRAVLKGVRR